MCEIILSILILKLCSHFKNPVQQLVDLAYYSFEVTLTISTCSGSLNITTFWQTQNVGFMVVGLLLLYALSGTLAHKDFMKLKLLWKCLWQLLEIWNPQKSCTLEARGNRPIFKKYSNVWRIVYSRFTPSLHSAVHNCLYRAVFLT